MLKKGYNLFETSLYVLSGKVSLTEEPKCCEICTFLFSPLCKPFCKYRKATYHEWLYDSIGEDIEQAYSRIYRGE